MKWDDQRPAGAPSGAEEDVAGSLERVQLAFAWGSLLGGVIAGFAVFRASGSWAWALLVALLTVYVIGRAACDLVTDDRKLRRAAYFAIFPASAMALALVGSAFLPAWAGAVIGFAAGWVIQQTVGWWLLPGIQAEEHADDMKNVRGMFGAEAD